MTSVETITNILNEQVNSYRTLLNLLQRERDCLLDFNAEGVEELSKEKDTLVLKLRLLEDERIRLMKKFSAERPASDSNRVSDDVSLQKLWELTGDNTFLDMRSKLISLLQSIEELNEFNRLLIERSLYHIKNTASFFESFGFSCNTKGKGNLLSMET